MKSVIVDIKDGFAAVLSNDGCIVKVKNNNYEIGQVIEMKSQITKRTKKILTWAATAATFVMISGVSLWSYVTPHSYVSLDVNPSIEFSLNRFDQVLSVKAINDDGQEIINEMQLDEINYKKIEDAITITVDQISSNGYFDGDTSGGIVIATYGDDLEKSEQLAQNLEEDVVEKTLENGDNVDVDAISVGLDRVQRARELNVTPGKLNLVEKLQASSTDPNSVDLNEWLNKPVKEIMQATKENKKAQKLTNAIDSPKVEKLEEINESENGAETVNTTINNKQDSSKEKPQDKSVENPSAKQDNSKGKSQDKPVENPSAKQEKDSTNITDVNKETKKNSGNTITAPGQVKNNKNNNK